MVQEINSLFCPWDEPSFRPPIKFVLEVNDPSFNLYLSSVWTERSSLGFRLTLFDFRSFRPVLSVMWSFMRSFRGQGRDLRRNRHFNNFWMKTHELWVIIYDSCLWKCTNCAILRWQIIWNDLNRLSQSERKFLQRMIKILKFEFVWNFGDFLNQRGNKISQNFIRSRQFKTNYMLPRKMMTFFWDRSKCTT